MTNTNASLISTVVWTHLTSMRTNKEIENRQSIVTRRLGIYAFVASLANVMLVTVIVTNPRWRRGLAALSYDRSHGRIGGHRTEEGCKRGCGCPCQRRHHNIQKNHRTHHYCFNFSSLIWRRQLCTRKIERCELTRKIDQEQHLLNFDRWILGLVDCWQLGFEKRKSGTDVLTSTSLDKSFPLADRKLHTGWAWSVFAFSTRETRP